MKRRYLVLLTIVLLSLLAGRELMRPGFFETHDGGSHVMRLAHFDLALKAGQFPVRWTPTWMSGYGSPVFNFNWTFAYYLGSLIHTTGMSYETTVKLLFLLSLPLSALAMFYLLYEITKDEWASMAGSTSYVWSPYRFTDIFIRGALGEALAFVFLPLVLLIVVKTHRTQSPWWAAFIWCLLILTHNVIALM